MAVASTSHSPKGTKPQPVRRSTKHKRVTYGRELMEKAAERRARRALAAQLNAENAKLKADTSDTK